ncbi:hypothetical protein FH972_022340 [Carpinus fangiana]|uniref:Uncharacterized protein n=1 Tax=Carpinus fangiana TaxID=176857 RepID=A0A5N6KSB0_9ROSI|nr:hypothetical protein FH972_022340 [Carpinus fangiana]
MPRDHLRHPLQVKDPVLGSIRSFFWKAFRALNLGVKSVTVASFCAQNKIRCFISIYVLAPSYTRWIVNQASLTGDAHHECWEFLIVAF